MISRDPVLEATQRLHDADPRCKCSGGWVINQCPMHGDLEWRTFHIDFPMTSLWRNEREGNEALAVALANEPRRAPRERITPSRQARLIYEFATEALRQYRDHFRTDYGPDGEWGG